MKSPIGEIEAAVKRFKAVDWSSSGYPIACERGEPIDAGWVKFGLQQSPLGWRTLEFLAWMYTDMIRAGERLKFFPTSPPPHLNTPGPPTIRTKGPTRKSDLVPCSQHATPYQPGAWDSVRSKGLIGSVCHTPPSELNILKRFSD